MKGLESKKEKKKEKAENPTSKPLTDYQRDKASRQSKTINPTAK